MKKATQLPPPLPCSFFFSVPKSMLRSLRARVISLSEQMGKNI